MSGTKTWMPMYWGDYLRNTTHLSAAEHGAYLMLIAHYWTTQESLPDNDEQLRRIARMERAEWKRARPTLIKFFSVTDQLWRHDRIDAELQQWGERKTKAEDRARTAAEKRWGKEKQSSEHATSIPTSNAPDVLEQCPSPSPSSKNLKPLPVGDGSPREGRIKPATDEAKRIAKHFLAEREKAWPNESGFPAPVMTIETEAQGFLDSGGPEALIVEMVDRGIADYLRNGKSTPKSLKAFRLTIEGAIQSHHRGASTLGAAHAQPVELSSPERRAWFAWFLRAKRYREDQFWHDSFGERPGHRYCDMPKDLQTWALRETDDEPKFQPRSAAA